MVIPQSCEGCSRAHNTVTLWTGAASHHFCTRMCASVGSEGNGVAYINSSACLLQPSMHWQCFPANLGKSMLCPGPLAVGCRVTICLKQQVLRS